MSVAPVNPSPESQSLWYYADATNQPVGPLPMDVLQQLASVGVISPETHILEEGGTEWKKFSSIVPLSARVDTKPASSDIPLLSAAVLAKENTKANGEISLPARSESVPLLSRNDGTPTTAKGLGETITLLEDKVQISRNFFAAIGKAKLTEIPLSAIRAIRWKAPGLLAQGYIQFLVGDSSQVTYGVANDAHAVTFSKAEWAAFQVLRRDAEQKLGFPISEETPAASECADKAAPEPDGQRTEQRQPTKKEAIQAGAVFFLLVIAITLWHYYRPLVAFITEGTTIIIHGILVCLQLCAILTTYFLPSLMGRKKRNAKAIFALNLFLGWTLVGWVVSLVWALTKDTKQGGDLKMS